MECQWTCNEDSYKKWYPGYQYIQELMLLCAFHYTNGSNQFPQVLIQN